MTDDGMQTRAHLEAQLASTLALNSPNEYRQCLLSYIRFLARFAALFLVIQTTCTCKTLRVVVDSQVTEFLFMFSHFPF